MGPSKKPLVKFLVLRDFCILRQLKLEEALLRGTSSNWCVVTDGAASTSVVMGLSGCALLLPHAAPVLPVRDRSWRAHSCGPMLPPLNRKAEVMVNREAVHRQKVPVLRRFSGGGTVVVDKDTLFSSLIFSMDAVPGVQPFPSPLMTWSETVFKKVFREEPTFALRENGAPVQSKCSDASCCSACTRCSGSRWRERDSVLATGGTDDEPSSGASFARRLRVRGAEIRGQCADDIEEPLRAPHVVPLGL